VFTKKVNLILDGKSSEELDRIDQFFNPLLKELDKSERYITLVMPFEQEKINIKNSEIQLLFNLQTNDICELFKNQHYHQFLPEFYTSEIDVIDFGNKTDC
jgi:hypothetical protein